MGTVLILHKQNKMKYKNRPHIAPILHPLRKPDSISQAIALEKQAISMYNNK